MIAYKHEHKDIPTYFARLNNGDQWIKIAADSVHTALANGYEVRRYIDTEAAMKASTAQAEQSKGGQSDQLA